MARVFAVGVLAVVGFATGLSAWPGSAEGSSLSNLPTHLPTMVRVLGTWKCVNVNCTKDGSTTPVTRRECGTGDLTHCLQAQPGGNCEWQCIASTDPIDPP